MPEHFASGTAILGILMAIPLMLMWRTRPSNLWLGLFVLSISMLCMTEAFLGDAMMFGIFDWPVAAFGAFYYFYVRSVIGRPLRPVDSLHAVPFVLFCCLLIVMWLDMFGWLHIGEHIMVPLFSQAMLIVQLICLAYMVVVFHLLHRHRRHVREFFSATARRDLVWLTWLTALLLVVFAIWIFAIHVDGRAYIVLALARLAILYFVAWFGSRQVAVFQADAFAQPAHLSAADRPADPAPRDAPELPDSLSAIETQPASPNGAAPAGKYARSGMTDAARDLIGQRLQVRMAQQHDYLENDITLGMLAERIGAVPNLVSQYLNDVLKTSFFDYVNGYRVAAVERKMSDPATADMTLLDMALASGFNSKSTFNAAFKRVHGVAPSIWRNARLEPTTVNT